MTLSQGQQSFVNAWTPYAQVAAQHTGVPWPAILAQWADETAWGTAPAFTGGHNFAGVSPGGQVASYPSPAAGLAAYIQTLLLPAYAPVRNAGAQGPVAAAQALGASPWAASHYSASGGGPGSDLVAILDEAGLASGATLTSAGGIGGAIAGGIGAASNAAGNAAQSGASDIAAGVVSDLVDAAKKPALMAAFLVLAGALVVAGAWHAVAPQVRPAVDKAKAGVEKAAVAAVAA